MAESVQRIVLASRPVGEPTLDNFRLEELPIPQPGPGQMLLRTLWLSLDPYMRGRMSDAPSYAKPVGIGDVMEGGTVSEVVAANVARFTKGDIVVGRTGWQTHALSDGSSLQKVEPARAPIQTALGVLGMPGMTAYMGCSRSANPPLARPWWSRQLLVRSARLSARSPGSRVPTPSASRGDQINAVT
jgi:NADPH-dependent curcumin reductase